jgi:hypothetical protein
MIPAVTVVIERHRGRDVLAVEARDQGVKGAVIRPSEGARWQTEDAQALGRVSGRFRAFRVSVRPSLCGRLRFGVQVDNTRSPFAGTLAGATGLEPATSGVTGRYDATGYDPELLATAGVFLSSQPAGRGYDRLAPGTACVEGVWSVWCRDRQRRGRPRPQAECVTDQRQDLGRAKRARAEDWRAT